jgi:type I restriction-modification system, M subunit
MNMSNLSGFVRRLRDIMRNDAGINGDAQRIEQIVWMLFLKVYDAKELEWEINEDNYLSIIPEECRWMNWAHDDKSGRALTGDALLDFVNNTLFPTLKRLPVDVNTPIKKSIVQTTFADANNYMKDGVLLRQVINVIDDIDFSDYDESHAFGDIYETILKELQSAGSSGEFYTPRAVTDFMAAMINPKVGEVMADFACGTGGFLISWLNELHKKVKTVADEEAYSSSIYGIEKKQFPYMLAITNLLLHDVDTPRIFHDNSLLKDVLDYTDKDKFDVVMMNPPYGGSEKNDVKSHFPADLASSETADLFMSVIMYRLKIQGRAAVILPDGFLFGTDNAKVNIKKKLLNEFNLHTIIRLPSSVFSPYTSITTNILFFDNTEETKETWIYRLDMPEGYKHFSKTKPMKLEHFKSVMDWWNNRIEIEDNGFDKAKKYLKEELECQYNYNLDLCGYPYEEEVILAPHDLILRYQEERASLNAEIDRVLEEITALLGRKLE